MAEAVRERFATEHKGRPGRKSLFINKDKPKAMRFTPACLEALDKRRAAKSTSRADYLEQMFWKDEARQTSSAAKLCRIFTILFGRKPEFPDSVEWLKAEIADA